MAKVLITDVTRMSGTNVCVAGTTGERTVRLNDPAPNEELLKALGGLKPGDVLQLDWTAADHPRAPHTEDGSWVVATARKLEGLTEAQFKKSIGKSASDRITEVFGKIHIEGKGGKVAFRPDQGKCSIITVVAHDVEVYVDFEKIRVSFRDAERSLKKVALEDLVVRKHQIECRSCKKDLTKNLVRDFTSASALLRLGLSRPYETPIYNSACWVQVNGVYPLDRDRQHFA